MYRLNTEPVLCQSRRRRTLHGVYEILSTIQKATPEVSWGLHIPVTTQVCEPTMLMSDTQHMHGLDILA